MNTTTLVFDTPLGHMKARANESALIELEFTEEPLSTEDKNVILTLTQKEIGEYFL